MELGSRSKKEILLDLADMKETARVCRALSSEIRLEILKMLVDKPMTISQLAEAFYLPMSSMCLHVKTLENAGLIALKARPGIRGTKKMCGIIASDVTINLFAHVSQTVSKPPVYISMPIGNYCQCEVTPPCGLASGSFYIYEEDSPYGFYSPERTNASLLWLTSGFLEYRFSNDILLKKDRAEIDHLEFSFEICAEAPGYNNEWPSDIYFELNGYRIMTFHIAGDYGDRRGIQNPSWWSNTSTQYGEYKMIRVNHQGCYYDGEKVSDETIESLGLTEGYYFTFCLGVDPNSEHVGGMNLFGKCFGDYAQDIVMKIEYV